VSPCCANPVAGRQGCPIGPFRTAARAPARAALVKSDRSSLSPSFHRQRTPGGAIGGAGDSYISNFVVCVNSNEIVDRSVPSLTLSVLCFVADLERFPIKLHRAHPLPTPHQGGGPVSALPFVLPPPRWGRVGVGVMRAERVDSVENRSNRRMRCGSLRRSALSGSRCDQPQIIASAHAENFTYRLHSGPRRFSTSSLTTSIGLAAALS
jgi:hypothetical protein